jgi:hypothetical protein
MYSRNVMHRGSVGLAVAVIALALLGAARPAYAQGCTKDTDCKGSRVCEGGRCVEPPPPPAPEPAAPPPPPPCQKDTDCEGDLVCENGTCGVAGQGGAADDGAAAAEPTQAEPEMAAAETEPPEPEYEEPPPQPDPASVWVQGFWDWYNDQWAWRSGAWRTPPAGMAYVAPHYEVVRGKVAYTRGHWGPPKAKPRSYGGRELKFKAAPRPTGYVKGHRPMPKPSPGVKVGKRPAGNYKWAGKPTHKFVVPPPKPKPAVTLIGKGMPPRPLPPTVRPGPSPTPVGTRPPVATPTGTRTPPRPLGLDSKEGTRCR